MYIVSYIVSYHFKMPRFQCATCPCKHTWDLSVGKGQSCCITCKSGKPCRPLNPRPQKPICDDCYFEEGLSDCSAECIAADCKKHKYNTVYPHDNYDRENARNMITTVMRHASGAFTRFGQIIKCDFDNMSGMGLGAMGVEIADCENKGKCKFCDHYKPYISPRPVRRQSYRRY